MSSCCTSQSISGSKEDLGPQIDLTPDQTDNSLQVFEE